MRPAIPKAKSFNAGTLTADTALALLKKHARGKFAKSSTLRVAKRFVELLTVVALASADKRNGRGFEEPRTESWGVRGGPSQRRKGVERGEREDPFTPINTLLS